jgi:hypothetical protein
MPTGIELVTIPGSEFSADLATQAELDAAVTAAGLALTTHNSDTSAHTGLSKVDGSRAFTAEVAGVSPAAPAGLTTKGYVDAAISALSSVYALITRTITGTGMLAGGGDLSSNRTLNLATAADSTILGVPVGGGTSVPIALSAAQARAVTGQHLHNVTTTDPTVNDDTGDGYSIGSRWVNTTTDRVFTCCDATAAAAVWTCSDLVRTQTVSGASATISPGINHVLVTYASGTCTLTLPTEANAAIGSQILIEKANTSAFGIVVTPDSGSAINGGSTNATVTPSFLAAPSAASTADPATLFLRTGSTAWRFM